MRITKLRVPALLAAAFAMIALTLFAGGAVFAQDATPATDMGMDVAHPAHIHAGTCATLGAIVWPLNDVSAPGMATTMMGTPVSGTPIAGTDMATPAMDMSATPMAGVVAQSSTTVKVNLADLEKSPYAINVHESLPNISNYIACGDITGAITNNILTVELKELNGSGFSGSATLVDQGDGTTTVTIQLMKASS